MEVSIDDIAKDPHLVSRVIGALIEFFPDLHKKYNKLDRDPFSFYLTGHCASFAYVLHEIFEGRAVIKDSTGHVIVEMYGHLYDIRGCVDGMVNLEEYKDCPMQYFPYVEALLTTPADHDNELREDLIRLGKMEIQNMLAEKQKNREMQQEEGKSI